MNKPTVIHGNRFINRDEPPGINFTDTPARQPPERWPNRLRLVKPAMGKRDVELARVVIRNIRETMPPVLVQWCPRIAKMLHDYHLAELPLWRRVRDLTLPPHQHDTDKVFYRGIMMQWDEYMDARGQR
jgi:hypothetical protein